MIYIHFFLLLLNGNKINIVENINSSFRSVLKKYFNDELIGKIKAAKLNGKQLDFDKTLSENKIEENSIINLITSKDFDTNYFNSDNAMNFTSYNFNDILYKRNEKNISQIQLCLMFTNGEYFNVIVNKNFSFISILKYFFKEKSINKIIKATINGEQIDFNKTISENKIESGNSIYLTVPKDFNLNSSKKYIYIHFFLLLLNGNKINIVENINSSFRSVLKKYFNDELIGKIKAAKLNGKQLDFDKTLSENKIEENSIINLITSKDFDTNYFNSDNAMNFTSYNFNDILYKRNEKNISQIQLCLMFTNGEYFNVIVNKNFSFISILKYFFKEKSINKIIKATINGEQIDFNKTISENKIDNGNRIYLIVSKDFNLKNDINNCFYFNNDIYYYYYCNNFYNSNKEEENKILSKFEFFISFTDGESEKVEGKPNDILKLKLKDYIKKKFPNDNHLLNNKIIAIKNSEKIDINKTLFENKISQGSSILFTFDEDSCNIEECKIHLHTKMHTHGLVLLYSNRPWMCDVCKLQFSNREQTYYCSICDFDICNHCIGNIKKYPLNYIFNENIFFYHFNYQFHKHKLIYCRTSRYDDKSTKWTCQLCNKNFGNETWSFFCTNCNYDICLSCAKNQYKNIDYTLIRFIYHGKPHFLKETNLEKKYECNLCKQSFMDTRSYSCLKCKNFNLCIDCIYDLAISINKKIKHGFVLHLLIDK